MAQNVKVGESGRPFYFNIEPDFDLSSFTRMELRWTKPDGSQMIRDSSASGVRLGTSTVFVTALSATLSANTYALYTIGTGSAGEIDQKGDWKVQLTYEVSTDTPITRLISDKLDSADNAVVMTVEAGQTSAVSADGP